MRKESLTLVLHLISLTFQAKVLLSILFLDVESVTLHFDVDVITDGRMCYHGTIIFSFISTNYLIYFPSVIFVTCFNIW